MTKNRNVEAARASSIRASPRRAYVELLYGHCGLILHGRHSSPYGHEFCGQVSPRDTVAAGADRSSPRARLAAQVASEAMDMVAISAVNASRDFGVGFIERLLFDTAARRVCATRHVVVE